MPNAAAYPWWYRRADESQFISHTRYLMDRVSVIWNDRDPRPDEMDPQFDEERVLSDPRQEVIEHLSSMFRLQRLYLLILQIVIARSGYFEVSLDRGDLAFCAVEAELSCVVGVSRLHGGF